jgi:4-hydroxy-tetrahydrodipicolinate synthase
VQPPFRDYVPGGVIPAVLLPFDRDLEIDEPSFRKHLRDVTGVQGLSAITVNAHSTEVATCTFEEQIRVLDISLDEVGSTTPVIAGVMDESTAQAQRIARMAQEHGASALLVFPPRLFIEGAIHRPEMIKDYYRRISDASDLPLILFQFSLESGAGTPLDTIVELAEELPNLRAIKDSAGHPIIVERNLRVLQNLSRPVNVLTTHSAWLLGSLVVGCNGILSGSGSTVAPFQVAIFQAVQRGDLAEARRINDLYYPIASAFYADPFLDMHNRMKEAQVLLGRLPYAYVRPPLLKIPPHEIETIKAALQYAGLLVKDDCDREDERIIP